MRIVFFGSSDFAIPSLKALKSGGFSPALVVTKPDAPRGRGRKIYDSEVKLAAAELGLPFSQPSDPHGPEFLAELKRVGFDLGVVVSYGVILRPELLAMPGKGLINAHASLLPLYRGAAPIQRAMREGQTQTGVTIMRIVEELDAGDMLLQKVTPIDPRENSGALRERLAELSGEALIEALKLIESGKATYKPQDHGKATYAAKVEKEHGLIDWKLPAVQVDLLVRAMTPKPGAQTRLGNKRFIVMEGSVEQDLYGMGIPGALQSSGEEGIRVCTGKDLYRITRIKPDNGRNMTAGEFVRGHHIAPDARFG
ncbi:MAG TPA: methionyl-tRNA formyltransferase [Planctomycetota bacterium]|nr:methionyl-tRNA formyltransferase [Planctomycetota bacterium]